MAKGIIIERKRFEILIGWLLLFTIFLNGFLWGPVLIRQRNIKIVKEQSTHARDVMDRDGRFDDVNLLISVSEPDKRILLVGSVLTQDDLKGLRKITKKAFDPKFEVMCLVQIEDDVYRRVHKNIAIVPNV